jgi:polar amino acid transport system permease protein
MQASGINVLFEGINFWRLLEGLGTTLEISLLSVLLSIPLGLAFGLLMTLKNPLSRALTKIILEFVRIMPQLVLLFLVYFGLTRSFGWNLDAFWSAIIVFTLWGTAEMGDLVRGSLISIPKHQYESSRVLGLSKWQMYRFIIIPQTIRHLLPPSINLITRMIKTTSLVVLIGMVEVLKVGQQIIDANRFQYPTAALWVYGTVFILYFLACWPISLIAQKLETKWKDN